MSTSIDGLVIVNLICGLVGAWVGYGVGLFFGLRKGARHDQ